MENGSPEKELTEAEVERTRDKDTAESSSVTEKSDTESPDPLSTEVELLRKSLLEKENIIRDYENLLKKIQADFDNYRKRVEREREEYSKLVNERLVKKLVNIIDDLDRGLSETHGNGAQEAFRSGIEKIRENTMQILAEDGLKEIPTNRLFDPYYHEALVVQENSDYGDNEIMEVYQKGYTLNGKVIRPAKVRVSRRVEKKQSAEETDRDV